MMAVAVTPTVGYKYEFLTTYRFIFSGYWVQFKNVLLIVVNWDWFKFCCSFVNVHKVVRGRGSSFRNALAMVIYVTFLSRCFYLDMIVGGQESFNLESVVIFSYDVLELKWNYSEYWLHLLFIFCPFFLFVYRFPSKLTSLYDISSLHDLSCSSFPFGHL